MPGRASNIAALLSEVEAADPVDFASLPIDDDEMRQMILQSVGKFSEDLLAQGLDAEARETLALALLARVLMDNLKLRYEQLAAAGAPDVSAQDLIAQISRGSLGRGR